VSVNMSGKSSRFLPSLSLPVILERGNSKHDVSSEMSVSTPVGSKKEGGVKARGWVSTSRLLRALLMV
jgi:hypothetical protein